VFFLSLSLLTTKIHNCSLCLLVIKSNMFVIPKYLGSIMVARSTHLRFGIVWQTQDVWIIKFKLFLKYDWTTNQTLPHSTKIFHSYIVELNCQLFFICAKNGKKILSSNWFISSLQTKTFLFLYILWMKILILCFYPCVG